MVFGKLAPKGVKLCPGCPPRTIEPLVTPKFVATPPKKTTDTKVVNVVDMKKYKNKGGRQNSLF